MAMSTTSAVQTIVALLRAAKARDDQAGAILLPTKLAEAQGLLMTAISILEAITAGPDQEQVMNYLIRQAETIEGYLPEPEQPGGKG